MVAGAMSALIWVAAQAASAGSGSGAGTDTGTAADVRGEAAPPGGELQGAPGAVTQPSEEQHPPAARPTVAQPGRIELRNELGPNYHINELTVLLDGRPVRREQVQGDGDLRGPLAVYDGPLGQGTHKVEVRAKVQGRNRAGLFSYMDNYQLDVRSQDVFSVTDHPVAFTLVVGERKGATVPFEQRPTVVVRSDVTSPPTQTAVGSGAARIVR